MGFSKQILPQKAYDKNLCITEFSFGLLCFHDAGNGLKDPAAPIST